ncbi:uncharacterized protein LOC144005130 [Festucalex cinctus]
MTQAFMNDMEQRSSGLDHLFHTAAALDPRFKSLPFLNDSDVERIFTSISEEATSLHEKATAQPAEKVTVQTDPCQTDRAHEVPDITTNGPQINDVPPTDYGPPSKKRQLWTSCYEKTSK